MQKYVFFVAAVCGTGTGHRGQFKSGNGWQTRRISAVYYKACSVGFNARPHLYPLPQERIFFGRVLWYPIASFVNPVAGISKNAGSVSPSPCPPALRFGVVLSGWSRRSEAKTERRGPG